MLSNLSSDQVRMNLVPSILEDERLAPVKDDHPITVSDLQL
jgi:hypothetical protein